MSRIMFVPVCENCGHEFTELKIYRNFLIQCPKCGVLLKSALIPNYESLMKTDEEGIPYCYYNKEELY